MMQQNQDTVFRPDTFDATVFQVLYSSNDPGGTFVAQTSATPLVQPLTRKRYEQIMAEKQARLDQWNALTPLERLRIELDEFATEYNENLDFSNSGWVEHRQEELADLIEQTKYKIERWELATAYRAKRR